MRTRVLGLVAALAAFFSTAGFAAAQTCESDADCGPGEWCAYPPCAPPTCDPDDETCEPPVCDGMCVEDSGPTFDECATDDECDGDWVCEVVGGTACAGVVCPDGVECPDPEPCETEDITACVPPPPAPCASDDDCADDLVCVTYAYIDCPPMVGRDCPPGSDCPDPEPVDCTEETESYCVPPYFAPCEVNDDCGPGFACVEGEACGCSGGGGTGVDPGMGGGSGGDDAGSGGEDAGSGGGEPEPPDCFCEPTGELYCELDDMPCLEEADCPVGFVCEALPSPTVPCSYDEDTGETVCDEPVDDDGTGQCVPAGWETWVGGGPAPTSAEDYDQNVGAAVGGDAESSSRAGEIDNPGGGGDGNVRAGEGSGGSAGGCAVAGGAGGLGQALLLGLALLIAVRRPRRRG